MIDVAVAAAIIESREQKIREEASQEENDGFEVDSLMTMPKWTGK